VLKKGDAVKTFKTDALAKAIIHLEEGVGQASAMPENELMRDGVIQRFEYTMDLSWKLMQRYLKLIAELDESNIYSKKDLFREAAKLKLIESAESWIGHYEARNQTLHDYNFDKAKLVYERAKTFLPDAQKLLKRFDELR